MLHAHRRAVPVIPLPKRMPRDTRQAVESAIEQHQAAMEGLVALLDLFDGDRDLEPSLASQDPAVGNIDQTHWAESGLLDMEQDVQSEPHDEGDEGNDEPSLAHTNDLNQETARRHTADSALRLPRGMGWVHNAACGDFEAEHDGREPEAHT